jgi:hypothetical protein
MDHERRVDVVLCETERSAGMLRFVLEGEGFDIVGLASSDEDLDRVLQSARPSVIVLDAGISATAALDAKERANGARLVVVWPDGVAAVIAEERVDPHSVIDDLGDAVRRASLKAPLPEPVIAIPEPLPDAPSMNERDTASALSAPSEDDATDQLRIDQSLRRILLGVGASILVLISLSTIAVAMPKALDLFSGGSSGSGGRGPHPSLSPIAPSPSSAPTDIVGSGQTRHGGHEPSAGPKCQPGKAPTDRGNSSTDHRADLDHSRACGAGGGDGDINGDSARGGGRPAQAHGHRGDQGKGPNADRAGGRAHKPAGHDQAEEARGGATASGPTGWHRHRAPQHA